MTLEARPWRMAEFVVHYVYLGTMLLNGALFFWLPQVAKIPYQQYKMVFFVLVAAVALSFPIAYAIYRRFVSRTALEHIRLLTGEGKACSVFKIGTVLLTCVGDFSGIAGASFFTFTRDANGLVVFLASWGVQYGLSALWVSRGRSYFEKLSNSTANSKTASSLTATL